MKINWKRGFTLIELLIVIVVLGVLATVVMIAINPLGMINSANLAKVKTFAASTENALIISQVGKWDFNDQSNPGKDTSGYGNDGTLNSVSMWKSAADDACKDLGFGGCLYFNGGNYVNIPNSVKLGTDWTISVWVKTATSNQSPIASNRGLGGLIYFGMSSGKAFIYQNECSPQAANGNKAINNNAWHFYIFVRNSSSMTGKIYIDGVLDTSTSATSCQPQSGAWRIGYDTSNAEFFSGILDEFIFYSQALTAQNIQQLYVQGLSKHQLVYNK